MADREKVIGLLQETAEYFRECRSNASFASKAENHFWELQNAANEAVELLKEQESEAKWIYAEDGTGVDGWYCSECDFFEPWFYNFTDDIDFIRYYEYCPGCGRKMTSYTGKPTQSGR